MKPQQVGRLMFDRPDRCGEVGIRKLKRPLLDIPAHNHCHAPRLVFSQQALHDRFTDKACGASNQKHAFTLAAWVDFSAFDLFNGPLLHR